MASTPTDTDNIILDSIFDPENTNYSFDLTEFQSSSGTDATSVDTMLRPSSLSDEELVKLKELEALGIKAAENGDFSKAITYFDTALNLSDTYSSAYNNRAQCYRMMKEYECAWKDVHQAIELHQDPLVLRQAYAQRALMRKCNETPVGDTLACDEREKLIRSDFVMAAKYGNPVARKYLALTNPYATMCNDMIRQMTTTYNLNPFS